MASTLPPTSEVPVVIENTERDALVAKIVSMAVLGLVPFALGVLPARLASYLGWNRHEKGDVESRHAVGGLAVSLLLCFGGGVLLCTTFLHLQPEVREGVEALQNAGRLPELKGIHLSELLICIGFFLVYLAEEVVHAVLDSRHEEEEAAALHRTVSLRRCTRQGHESGGGGGPTVIPRSSAGSPLDAETRMTGGPLPHIHSPAATATVRPEAPSPVSTVGNGHSHSHISYDTLRADSVAASLKGLLAVLALSFHAVFEGLAVGLESSASSVWVLCGAIAAHKFVIAFCVGVELVSSRTRPALLVAYVATFAMVTPLGIGAGIAVTAAESGQIDGLSTASSSVVAVILQGMAAGTLLYVVFFEVLQRERAGSHAPSAGLCHLLAILVGFGLMLGLQIL
ncbi:hypothetical protein J437_LFUL017108, partial [Ladona fulva]